MNSPFQFFQSLNVFFIWMSTVTRCKSKETRDSSSHNWTSAPSELLAVIHHSLSPATSPLSPFIFAFFLSGIPNNLSSLGSLFECFSFEKSSETWKECSRIDIFCPFLAMFSIPFSSCPLSCYYVTILKNITQIPYSHSFRTICESFESAEKNKEVKVRNEIKNDGRSVSDLYLKMRYWLVYSLEEKQESNRFRTPNNTFIVLLATKF